MRKNPLFGAAAIAAALLLGGPVSAGTSSVASSGQESTLEHVQALLEEAMSADELLREEAQSQLLGLEVRFLDPVLDVLLYRVPPSETSMTLTAEVELILKERLTTWPTERVSKRCLQLTRDKGLDEKLRAVELFAAFGDARSWQDLLTLCRAIQPEEIIHPLVSERLRQTIRIILERDRAGYDAASKSLNKAEPWLERAIVEALGMCGRGRALGLLSSLLDRDPTLDARILKAFGGWKRWDDSYEECIEITQEYLRSPEPDVRRAAATSLGRLEAGHAIPYLIMGLEDSHSGVRRSSLWSLRYITGIEFLSSSEEWLGWYDREETWREERAPQLLETAKQGGVTQALAAICEIGRHHWFSDMAEDMSIALRHSDQAVVQAACNALANIGGPIAFHALIELCEDERPDVLLAARSGFEFFVGRSYVDFDAHDLE